MFSGGEALGSFKGPATRGQKVEIHSGPGWEKKTGRYLVIQMNFGKAHNLLNLKEAYAVGISHVAPSKGRLTCQMPSFLIILLKGVPLGEPSNDYSISQNRSNGKGKS